MKRWTINNSLVRQNIFLGIKPDVICLQETRLQNNDVIHLAGYVTNSALFHNRAEINKNAKKGTVGSLYFHQNLFKISILCRL